METTASNRREGFSTAKWDYLTQLGHKLRVLPEAERTNALEYYDNYLSDAEDEVAAIAELGKPGEVAASILANYVGKEMHAGSGKKSGFKTAWIALLSVFALPIGLPIIIVLAVSVFMCFLALGIAVGSFWLSGVILAIAGLAHMIIIPFAFFEGIGLGLITAGQGLLFIGFGILFIKITALMMRGFPIAARFVGKHVLRRRKAHGR